MLLLPMPSCDHLIHAYLLFRKQAEAEAEKGNCGLPLEQVVEETKFLTINH